MICSIFDFNWAHCHPNSSKANHLNDSSCLEKLVNRVIHISRHHCTNTNNTGPSMCSTSNCLPACNKSNPWRWKLNHSKSECCLCILMKFWLGQECVLYVCTVCHSDQKSRYHSMGMSSCDNLAIFCASVIVSCCARLFPTLSWSDGNWLIFKHNDERGPVTGAGEKEWSLRASLVSQLPLVSPSVAATNPHVTAVTVAHCLACVNTLKWILTGPPWKYVRQLLQEGWKGGRRLPCDAKAVLARPLKQKGFISPLLATHASTLPWLDFARAAGGVRQEGVSRKVSQLEMLINTFRHWCPCCMRYHDNHVSSKHTASIFAKPTFCVV